MYLRLHHRLKHSGPRPDLDCPTCGVSLSSRHMLQLHINSKHLGLKEVCSECGRTFSCPSVLLRHLKETHGGQAGGLCQHCQLTFTRMSSLYRHLAKSHGLKNN